MYRTGLQIIMEKLKELHLALHSEVLDLMDNAVFWVSSEKNIISWNKSAEKIYGYDFKEIGGKSVNILFHPDTGLLDLENCRNINAVHITKDNKIKYVNLSIKQVKENYLIICADITEQRAINLEMEKRKVMVFNEMYNLFHDNLCQILTGLTFKFKFLETKIKPYIKANRDLKLQVNDINSIIESSIKNARIFEKQMLMMYADSENLEELINQYLESTAAKFKILFTFKNMHNINAPFISNLIFLLLQKLVSYVVINCKPEKIDIEVSDSGIETVIVLKTDGSISDDNTTIDNKMEFKIIEYWINMFGGKIKIFKKNTGLLVIECSIINSGK